MAVVFVQVKILAGQFHPDFLVRTTSEQDTAMNLGPQVCKFLSKHQNLIASGLELLNNSVNRRQHYSSYLILVAKFSKLQTSIDDCFPIVF